jgi:hypothetical protein
MNERGMEMKSQRLSNATNVPNGTAADDPFVQRIVFVTKNTEKRMPGINVDVRMILVFQLTP